MTPLAAAVGGLLACLAGSATAQNDTRSGPAAEPPGFVRVCDVSGTADFAVPGQETCLRPAGRGRGSRDAPGWPATTRQDGASWIVRDFLGSETPSRGELLAYTATFGPWAPIYLAPKKPAPLPAAGLTTIASRPDAEPIAINGISAPSFHGGAGGEVPDIIGIINQEHPLGSVQLDAAAALRVHAGLFPDPRPEVPSPAYTIPVAPSDPHESIGHRLGMDYLSPGDRLWLQAAYENPAYVTVTGAAPSPTSIEAETGRFGRVVLAPSDYFGDRRPQPGVSCIWTESFTCEPRKGEDKVPESAERPRPPTFGSIVSGASPDVRYYPGEIPGFGGAVAMPTSEEIRPGPRFIGMPITGFDIGAEFMYIDLKRARPAAAPGTSKPRTSQAAPVPATQGSPGEYQGRLRVQRAF
jgi:hypothetical protein